MTYADQQSTVQGKSLAGRYELTERLSVTPMAEVWIGNDTVLDRLVVAKLLAPRADEARFEREARAVAALAHANIVRLFDFGREQGRPYMIFEHLPGGSLEERLEGGALDYDEAVRVVTDVAAALAYAHAAGVVHRDLKPANILFDCEDRAKVADFGIAHLEHADTLTEPGTILGTAGYLSPEQAAGETATAASDVYALGVILYRMLCGRLPFDGTDPLRVAAMHLTDSPPPVTDSSPDVPQSLADLTTAALAKDPHARPADGAAVLAALAASEAAPERTAQLADVPTVAVPPPPAHAAPRRRASVRRRTLLALVAIAALAVAGLAAAVLIVRTPAPAPAVPVKHAKRHAPRRAETSTAKKPAGPAAVSHPASSTISTTAVTTRHKSKTSTQPSLPAGAATVETPTAPDTSATTADTAPPPATSTDAVTTSP